MTEEQAIKLLRRIKQSDDGPEFIEYLEKLSQQNYKAWKKSSSEDVFIKQGYAICVDSLLESFAECTKEIEEVPRSFTTWSIE